MAAYSRVLSNLKDHPVSTLNGVKVEISVVLGKAALPMQQLLRMGRGAVIELDAKQTDEVWILANNKPIARGEIVVQGEKIGVSITNVLKSNG
ncbi:MAG: FliM/FliN family flagellar motor switch protein [Micropepsaceae bacterium]